MADRVITAVAKDKKDRIVAIGNPGEEWSPLTTAEAIVHIGLDLHTYTTSANGTGSRIVIVNQGGRHYLRSSKDATHSDNLDDLPLLDTMNAHTGGFDVVVDVDHTLLSMAIEAAHSAEVLQHSATWSFDQSLIVLHFEIPEVRPLFLASSNSSDAKQVDQTTTLRCWVRSLDDIGDAGWFATVRFQVRINLSLRKPTETSISWILELSNLQPEVSDIVVTGVSEPKKAWLKTAILDYLKNNKLDAYPVKIDRIAGTPTDLAVCFTKRSGGQRIQVGASFGALFGTGFPVPSSSHMWSVALSKSYIARSIYNALAAHWGAAPPPGGLLPVSVGDGVFLDVLEVALDQGGIAFSGRLRRDDPAVTATFSMLAELSLTPNETLQLSFGIPSVTVNEWYAKIVDFFSGGAVSQAITQGLQDALGSQGQSQIVGFFSESILNDLLTFGKAATVKLTPHVSSFVVDRNALLIAGNITRPPRPKPVAELRVISSEERTVVFDASSSWVPGGNITAVRWRFGDGETSEFDKTDLALLVSHSYSQSELIIAHVDITGDDGGRSTASVTFKV